MLTWEPLSDGTLRESTIAKCGNVAVLEVEAYSHDFVLRDSQPICLMLYERTLATPERLYSADLKSNYAHQKGLLLAKWFKA